MEWKRDVVEMYLRPNEVLRARALLEEWDATQSPAMCSRVNVYVGEGLVSVEVPDAGCKVASHQMSIGFGDDGLIIYVTGPDKDGMEHEIFAHKIPTTQLEESD